MDPCPFVRVVVGNLAVRLPVAAPRPSSSGVHPSSSPCFCRVRLGRLPPRTAAVALDPSQSAPVAASFDLGPGDLGRLLVRVSVYTGRRGSTCGLRAGRLVGRVAVPLDLAGAAAEGRARVFYSGWVAIGKGRAEVHVTVRAEPDPRFVFEFEGEPECSPQVFQVREGLRQPVFTCKFSCRNLSDRCHRSLLKNRSLQSGTSSSRTWLGAFGSGRERSLKERKGWSIIVHDLSGSPVALASMVTPFVASPGTDRVSRSNPGAWLILRPGDGTWKPWGRLEAWREHNDRLGFRFDLSTGALLVESSLSTHKGGKFTIDTTGTTNGSGGDHGGFVMSSTVEGEGNCSKPTVEIGSQNVGCTEDAAAFVALAAALDLSMDACRLFSQKLRKELCGQQGEALV